MNSIQNKYCAQHYITLQNNPDLFIIIIIITIYIV